MIFDHFISPITGNPIIVPVNNPGQIDAWDIFDMLDIAFPTWYESSDLKFTQFNFNICCAGGYENAIEFTDSAP